MCSGVTCFISNAYFMKVSIRFEGGGEVREDVAV